MEAYIVKESLKYIIDKMGVDLSYISTKTKVDINKINQWLDSDSTYYPSFSQIEELSKLIGVPLATFYMQKVDIHIEDLPNIIKYRSYSIDVPNADSIMNIAIHSLLGEKNNYFDLAVEADVNVIKFSGAPFIFSDSITCAANIRNFLGLSLDNQFEFKSARQFYLFLRSRIEQKGIFVYCFKNVPLELCRGLAIYDDKMPIIGLNDDDRYPARSFSIIHELVHILKKHTCYCDIDTKYEYNQEEVFCNKVAAECLVPSHVLLPMWEEDSKSSFDTEKFIENTSKIFSVSREVITRRLLDLGKITNDLYDRFIKKFKDELEIEKELAKNKKPSYRGVKPGLKVFDSISGLLSGVLFEGLSNKVFSYQDIVRNTGVTYKSLSSYLKEVSKWKKLL